MPSFDNLGTAPGTVTGVRWWSLQAIGEAGYGLRRALSAPHRLAQPLEKGTMLALRGMYDYWHPGENIAGCKGLASQEGHATPEENCSCGFWAYWNVNSAPVHGDRLVMGVVEGYGKTLIGDRGFRCEKARLLALTCDFEEQRVGGYEEYTTNGAPIPLRHSGLDTYRALGGSPRGAVRRQAVWEDDGAATLAIETELEARYGVPVYQTPAYMLLKHPLTADYAGQSDAAVVDWDAMARYLNGIAATLSKGIAQVAEVTLDASKAMEELHAKMAAWMMSEPLDDGRTIDQALEGLATELKPPEA